MLFSILGIMLGVSCSDSDDEMGDEGDGEQPQRLLSNQCRWKLTEKKYRVL